MDAGFVSFIPNVMRKKKVQERDEQEDAGYSDDAVEFFAIHILFACVIERQPKEPAGCVGDDVGYIGYANREDVLGYLDAST